MCRICTRLHFLQYLRVVYCTTKHWGTSRNKDKCLLFPHRQHGRNQTLGWSKQYYSQSKGQCVRNDCTNAKPAGFPTLVSVLCSGSKPRLLEKVGYTSLLCLQPIGYTQFPKHLNTRINRPVNLQSNKPASAKMFLGNQILHRSSVDLPYKHTHGWQMKVKTNSKCVSKVLFHHEHPELPQCSTSESMILKCTICIQSFSFFLSCVTRLYM